MNAEYVTQKAVALIKKLHGAQIGAVEFSGGWMPERVDAILFNSRASFMIETKISRSDFKADFKKEFRKNGKGVGKYRYYACPNGLILPEELPEKWGLIYVNDGRKKATMPVGFGGSIKVGEEKDPEHGWNVGRWEEYGTPRIRGMEIDYDDPRQPQNIHAFEDRDMAIEARYLYALCTRYKSQKFMETVL